jgi:hypothetical protein
MMRLGFGIFHHIMKGHVEPSVNTYLLSLTELVEEVKGCFFTVSRA